VASTLKRQNGKCARCGLYFAFGDTLIESDHRTPRVQHGRDKGSNRQLLHGHCHDSKTAEDRIGLRRWRLDNDQTIEEPDEFERLTSGFEGGPTG
jgi:RNA-directed DNA polymerase